MLNENLNNPNAFNTDFSSAPQNSTPRLAQVGFLSGLTPPVLRSNNSHKYTETSPTMRTTLRRLTIGVVAFVTAVIAYLLLVNLVWTGLPTGTQAPLFAGTALDGHEIDLTQHHGQPVMLTFWSPDCFACREELPALQALANDPNANMQLITIVSGMESPEVAQFVAQENLNFPILVDPSGAIAQQYKVSGIPFTYFIDQDGQIDQSVIGAGPEGELQNNLFTWLQSCQIGEVCSAE